MNPKRLPHDAVYLIYGMLNPSLILAHNYPSSITLNLKRVYRYRLMVLHLELLRLERHPMLVLLDDEWHVPFRSKCLLSRHVALIYIKIDYLV